VTIGQYAAFLNAVAWSYSVIANWMANGQPVDFATAEAVSAALNDGAYDLTGGPAGIAPAQNEVNPQTGQAAGEPAGGSEAKIFLWRRSVWSASASTRLCSLLALSLLGVAVWSAAARAAEDHPLAPADTSSPRATLESFVETVAAIYTDLKDSRPSRALGDRLRRRITRVANCLDLSEVAPSLVDSEGRQAAVNLKEVLDRIELPPVAEIPDADAVVAAKFTRWRVPGTELTLVRLADGERVGEWVFSANTVARAEEFYRLAEPMPYRADAGSPGLHALYLESPGWMIPEAWVRGLPDWARRRAWDVAVWQWVAATGLLAGGVSLVAAAFAVARRWAGRPGLGPLLATLATPLMLMANSVGLDFLFTNQVRITGDVLFAAKTALGIGTFGGCVVLLHAVLTRLGEAVIRSRRLRPGTIDTQVMRLGFRILTVLAMAWLVIIGADSMGISVAPLIAGLGVGGLAVALAAQHTVENFIAGLVLYADKPVRIGDSCQFGEHRGTVEQIGLRSTRIRGSDRTVVSIPNSEFAKLRLVNYTRRDKILLKTLLALRYETTADQLRHVLAALRQLLTSHPQIDAESVSVRFTGYGAYSLDVEVFALAETNDWAAFLAIQEDVLLEVMDVVTGSGCGFAFPSQTHYMATDTGVDAEARRRAEAEVRDLRESRGLTVAGFLERGETVADSPAAPGYRIRRPAA
jgi:MscS family membrane protein